MSEIDWNDEKNAALEASRGVFFEDVLVCIENGDILDVMRHPNRERNPGVPLMNRRTHQLDQDEMQLLKDFENGTLERLPNASREKKTLENATRRTLQKDKRINIRISSRDLRRLQMRAAREGIPYQTYIASSLHKLVSGRLKEIG